MGRVIIISCGSAGGFLGACIDVFQKDTAAAVLKMSMSASHIGFELKPWVFVVFCGVIGGLLGLIFDTQIDTKAKAFSTGLSVISILMTGTPYADPNTASLKKEAPIRVSTTADPREGTRLRDLLRINTAAAAEKAGTSATAVSATTRPATLSLTFTLPGKSNEQEVRVIFKGRQPDSDSWAPLARASFVARPKEKFSFDIDPGEYRITVESSGYKIADFPVRIATTDLGREVNLEVKLEATFIPVQIQRLVK